jgi:hypothetical protein
MRSFRTSQVLCLMATLAITPLFGTTTHRHPSSALLRTASSKKSKKRAHVIHGQRAIDSDRASEIQNALIRQKYMTAASGQWDAHTQAAMQQYQSDHGWQTKLMPDSRALISLGLGPNHTNTAPTHPAEQAENTAQVQTAEPAAANTLASVHSLSQ